MLRFKLIPRRHEAMLWNQVVSIIGDTANTARRAIILNSQAYYGIGGLACYTGPSYLCRWEDDRFTSSLSSSTPNIEVGLASGNQPPAWSVTALT